MAIEDMFPEDFYLRFVALTYQGELKKRGIDKIVLNFKKSTNCKETRIFL